MTAATKCPSRIAIEHEFDTVGPVSTADRLLYSALHGTAMRYAAEQRGLCHLHRGASGDRGGPRQRPRRSSWHHRRVLVRQPVRSCRARADRGCACSSLLPGVAVRRLITASWSGGRGLDSNEERRRGAGSDEAYGGLKLIAQDDTNPSWKVCEEIIATGGHSPWC